MTIPSSLNSLARFTTVLPITMGLHTQLLYSRKSTAIVLHFLDLISCYDCSHTDGCPPRGGLDRLQTSLGGGHELIKGKVCFKYSLILKQFFEI